jgi:hypothetical protein
LRRLNREVMMRRVIEAAKTVIRKNFQSHIEAVNCHHNYVQQERHFGEDVYVTRKGAVSAKAGQLGIIPGSMGARSYIVRGKGNPESFESCSHGAGRVMSRGEAKRRFTLADHRAATEGVECRKDKDVIDETPAAYKDIDAVMEAQRDLVERGAHGGSKQVVCVKGLSGVPDFRDKREPVLEGPTAHLWKLPLATRNFPSATSTWTRRQLRKWLPFLHSAGVSSGAVRICLRGAGGAAMARHPSNLPQRMP